MPVYQHTSLDAAQARITGTVIADTPRTARDILRGRGLLVEAVEPVQSKHKSHWLRGRVWGRKHQTRVTVFLRELSTLLAVGIPMTEAIDTIARQHRGDFRGSLLILRDRVSEGQALAEAMSDAPELFDELTISIAEVGEDAGTLDASLAHLAEYRERMLQLKNRVTSALIYPGIVLVVGVSVTILIMTFVVPGLLATITESGRELPAVTRVVKAVSDTLVNRWWLVLAIAVSLFATITYVLRTRPGRRLWHRVQLRVPILGDLIRKQAISRMAVIMATLLRSGVVFVRATRIAQRSTRNTVLSESLARCADAVESGHDIAPALEQTGAFPPVVIQVFSVGQQSGRLEEMLERLAVDYDREVNAAATRLTSVLEPLLIVLMAILVGVIAMATLMPILEAGNVY